MEKNEIYVKTENPKNINKKRKSNYFSTMPNLRNRKSIIYNEKPKFKQNVLLNLLKKLHLKHYHIEHPKQKINQNYNINILNKNFKLSYNLNKKFQDLPCLSKFHNITDEKISDLIKSNNNDTFNPSKSYKIANLKNNFNYKNKNKLHLKRNKTPLLKNNTINDGRYISKINNNFIINKNKKNLKRFKISSKIKNLKLNEMNLNFTKSQSYLKNKYEHNSEYINTNSLSKTQKPIIVNDTISSNIKKIKLNKINTNLETKMWLNSIKDSIEEFDFFRRSSKLDRLLFYMVNPEECFEENLLDIRPGDKYQSLKNQIIKHKSKLESILNEIKLNQIKNEHLMKKYIFDLLSRKKKIY